MNIFCLFVIDVSQVEGYTHLTRSAIPLRQVFDAAEEGGVILLFDEVDALFGKRSEVKDSRARYAVSAYRALEFILQLCNVKISRLSENEDGRLHYLISII